jgi:transposase
MKNKYYFRARISERQFRHLLRLYCADVCALTAAQLAGVNQNTAHQLYTRWRTRVCALTTAESPPFTGEVEVDESYFGPSRVRGKRGRGGRWQDPGHRPAQARRSRLRQGRAGLFPRGVATHHPGPGAGPPHHLRRRLALLRRPRARRLPPSSHPPSRQPVCPGQNHVNGIESFWSFAKLRMATMRACAKPTLPRSSAGNPVALEPSPRPPLQTLAPPPHLTPAQLGKTH